MDADADPPRPWGPPESPPANERMFNAPLVVVLLVASIPALYFLQERAAGFWMNWAFRPGDLSEGRFSGLFTAMLLHNGWAHALTNAVGVLAFGPPVARLFRGSIGAFVFLALYIVSGAVGSLGFAALHWGSMDPMVGAYGGVFGLIGAATRLLGGRGRVLSLSDPGVIRMGIVWMAINAILGVIGFAPGVDGARIAWEAHAFGFLFGILAIGPLARVFARPDERFDSPAVPRDPFA